MILKQAPEDFRVEELTDVVAGSLGPFALYRLEKTGWTTPDALAALRRRWCIDARRLSYGGLKDRHAHTGQFLTIYHGPRRRLTHERIRVEYLGQVGEPYTSQQIRANRFELVLRDLSQADATRAEAALADVAASGLPNYFDDQRFGSVRPGQAFIARALVDGRFEEALKLALAAPYEYDRTPQKKEKALLRQFWGDWPKLKEQLPRGHARSLVTYLTDHPDDFRGAVARLRPELRGLYLSAYQSHLWNRMLARWLMTHVPAEELVAVALRLGEVPMPRRLSPEALQALLALTLPLPSARTRLADDDVRRAVIDTVLAEEGLDLGRLQVKGVREIYFSKGDRASCRRACALPSIGTKLVRGDKNCSSPSSCRAVRMRP
jgi:tRNA pseudouridine13 synthase